jgi:hypothetical protein
MHTKEAFQLGFNIEIEQLPVHADAYVTGFVVEAYPTGKKDSNDTSKNV